jgi:RHS repeat-associated protein
VLGFVDAGCQGCPPGGYSDNGGSLSADVTTTNSRVLSKAQTVAPRIGTTGATRVTGKDLADPVSSATGAFTESLDDLTTGAGRGVPFDLVRSYDSTSTEVGPFGPGWGHTLAERVSVDPVTGAATWFVGTGASLVFAADGAGGFVPPLGSLATLNPTVGGWQLRRSNQIVSTFDAAGRVATRFDRSGFGLSFAYDAAGRLSTVTDAAGFVHTFTYGVSGVSLNKLIRVQSSDNRVVRYTYANTSGVVRLATFVDERAKISTMSYDANGFLTKITDALGNSEATNIYDVKGRVISQADALGKISTFVWNDVNESVTMTDATGVPVTHDYGGFILDGETTPTGSTSTSYNSLLDVIGYTDQDGKQWAAIYDSRGNMLTRTDPLGRVETWTYDAMNNPLTSTDVTGVTTTFTYDVAGRVLTQTRGVTTSAWAWNADGTLASTTDALGHTTTYTYDVNGNRLTETTAGGAVTKWEYDVANRVSRMIPPRGNVAGANPATFDTQYRYDKAGNVILVNAPGSQTTRSTYDDAGRLVTETAPDLGVTTYGYNPAGEVLTITAPDNGVTSFTYSDRGEKLSQTDPVGAVTKWSYDAAGRMVTMIEPVGNVAGANPADYTWTYGYDNLGRQTTVTDPTGRVTTQTYDALGRGVTQTRPDGSSTTSYDPVLGERKVTVTDQIGRSTASNISPEGWMASSVDAKGHVTTYGYDNAGNRTSMFQADGSLTTWTYDVENRAASMVSPRGNVSGANPADYTTTYTYDLEGHQVTATDPLGRTTTTTYDGAGRTDIMTDPAGKTVNYGYDVMGRVKQVNATSLGATKYVYATNGTLTSRTDNYTKVTSYEYDLAHRLTKQVDPLGRYVTHNYDVNGRKTSMVDAVANAASNPALGTTTLGYDRLGRVTSKSFSDSTPTITWIYDPQGRVATMTDGTGTTTYTYDTANRVVSVVNGAGVTMTYGWDANNNLTDLNDGKQTFTRTYDTLDRLTGVTDAATGPVVSYGYDLDGNTTSMSYPGGTTQTRTVDRAGQLSGLTNTTATGLLRSYTYTRDLVGSPTKVAVSGPTGILPAESQLFEYDGASRLKKQCWTATTCTAAGQTTWAYDALGRRASEKIGSALATTYAYDAADQIVSTTQGTVVKPFAYNANGDQTVAPGMVSTFNAAHQTTSVATPGGTVTYGYAGNNNRTSSTVGGVTTRFDWDNISSGLPNVTAESIAGAVIRKYAYGHDMARTTNGTTNSFLLADPVGTITHLVSGAGATQAQYLTGAYGANKTTTVTDPSVASNPIRYTGQYTDPITGNVHLRARQYNPTLGMFTQTDPMPYGPGHAYESAYVYAYDNPMRFVDPSGLRGGECSYCDGDSIEYAHQFLKYKSPSELEALYDEYETMLKSIGEGSGPSGSDTHELSMLLPRRVGQRGLPTLGWAKNAFEAITLIWGKAPRAGKLPHLKSSRDPRTFESVDPLVADLANKIEAEIPGRINGVNRTLNLVTRKGFREVDIDLGKVIVQVKSGPAGGLTKQLTETARTLGRQVIGYAPDIPNGAWANAARDGIPIARNPAELLAILREYGIS